MNEKIFIKGASQLLGVNTQTLRRWDKSGRLKAKRKKSGKKNFYFYEMDDINDFLSENFSVLLKLAMKWSFSTVPIDLPKKLYCPDKAIFKARLSRFEFDLSKNQKFNKIFSLIVAVAGEIGNNSFDHNLGNWRDVNGIFFGYNLSAGKLVLADRGQGVLTTLKRAKPSLSNYNDALKIAFTEIISGRTPEIRGNGLKFVREVVMEYNFKLSFQSGNAVLNLSKKGGLAIKNSDKFMNGCFAILTF